MALARRAGRREVNIWPGWVDALSSIILVVVFVLMIFVIAQFFLQTALQSRDSALDRLRAQIADLSTELGQSEAENTRLQDRVATLQAALSNAEDRESELLERISALDDENRRLNRTLDSTKSELMALQGRLAEQTAETAVAKAEIAELNSAIDNLNREMGQLNEALDAAEQKAAAQRVKIVNLSKRLNEALASKVAQLARYRSEFFGRLREVLGDRAEVRIEGDRFVFQSEVLFESGSADLQDSGRTQLARLAETVRDISTEIPDDIDWILRVDGHTDTVPINTPRYPSNWALSTARALSVVTFLADRGIPPDRLAAAGFGEHQPIARGNSAEARRRNRRIELKLDQR